MNIKNIIKAIFVSTVLIGCDVESEDEIQFRDCNSEDVEIKIFGIDVEPVKVPEDPTAMCFLNVGPSNDPAQSGNIITWCNDNVQCCIADLSIAEYSCNF